MKKSSTLLGALPEGQEVGLFEQLQGILISNPLPAARLFINSS
jgi:hypothetical protein